MSQRSYFYLFTHFFFCIFTHTYLVFQNHFLLYCLENECWGKLFVEMCLLPTLFPLVLFCLSPSVPCIHTLKAFRWDSGICMHQRDAPIVHPKKDPEGHKSQCVMALQSRATIMNSWRKTGAASIHCLSVGQSRFR